MTGLIDTENLSMKYRKETIDKKNKKILTTNFTGTEQEKDLSEPCNCDGFGRIRHFKTSTSESWPRNTLPIQPACNALGIKPTDKLTAQVFQNAACNWRCWYCYVPFTLLSANLKYSKWLSASDLIELYLHEKAEKRPPMIDLSGGQPDLTPEWVPWVMHELQKRGLENEVYLWSDDNLSNDYFWRFLSNEDIELITSYKNYGKVCCFKGFDSKSFSFNTRADPQLYERQFSLMKRFMELDIDLYCYVTLTTPSKDSISEKINKFVDKLQDIDTNLPLRMIPLEISIFSTVKPRMGEDQNSAIDYQQIAIKEWKCQLEKRFSTSQLSKNITDIKLKCNV